MTDVTTYLTTEICTYPNCMAARDRPMDMVAIIDSIALICTMRTGACAAKKYAESGMGSEIWNLGYVYTTSEPCAYNGMGYIGRSTLPCLVQTAAFRAGCLVPFAWSDCPASILSHVDRGRY